jgi:predicted Zn-dependent protease
LRRDAPLEAWRRWTRRAVWRGLEALAGAEQRALGALDGGTSAESLARARPDLVERERIIAALSPILDSLAADDAWGKAEVIEAARAWRGVAVITRALARADVVHGRMESATARYDSLIALRTADPAMQLEVGDHYVRVGRTADARALFTHALEASPESEAPFRSLLALDRSPEALQSLEQQIIRLRLRQPKSLVLADRLIEVLHRLGRNADAARVVKELETLREERGVKPIGGGGA